MKNPGLLSFTDDTDLARQIKTLVGEQLGLAPARVGLDQNLFHDLGADSLDPIELSLSLEECFSVPLSADDSKSFHTPRDILNLLKERQRHCENH
jgi:acyl carrier protein